MDRSDSSSSCRLATLAEFHSVDCTLPGYLIVVGLSVRCSCADAAVASCSFDESTISSIVFDRVREITDRIRDFGNILADYFGFDDCGSE